MAASDEQERDGPLRDRIEALLGTVEQVMQRSVVSVHPDLSIGDAARELERRGVSGAPVVEEGRVIGVVTLRDLFSAGGVPPERAATSGPWHRYEHLLEGTPATVRGAMTSSVLTLPPEAQIAQAAEAMRRRGVNRIPIVDGSGAVVGMVTRDDVIEAVARAFRKVRWGLRSGTPRSRIEPG